MAALAMAATCLMSCANVSHGTTAEISVTSNPSGADVTLSNGMSGVTPFTITVPRERDLVFHFSKEGYQSADVFDETNVEGKYVAADWASILVTGLPVAWVNDVSSGAARTHEQIAVTANLVPDSAYVRPKPRAFASPAARETHSSSQTGSTGDAQSEK